MAKHTKKKQKRSSQPISKKAAKKQAKLWSVLGILAFILAALLVLLFIFQGQEQRLARPQSGQTDPSQQTYPVPSTPKITQPLQTQPSGYLPVQLGQGLTITHIAPYTGAYVEDGTNEVVGDVLMIILENTTSQALQYARIVMDYGDDQAVFTVTNLPAGDRVVLLEQSRMAYREGKADRIELEGAAFLETMDTYPELFEISGDRGLITVTNISDQTVSGDIYVYYKNSAQDIYYGGITYRARVEGGLAPGQTKQVLAGHYNPEGSAILMVTYVP